MIGIAFGLAVALATAPDMDAGVLNDRMHVVGSDVLSVVMVDYCRETAPARTAAVDAAFAKWRTISQVDAIRAAIGPDAVARTEAAVAAKRASTRQMLVNLGTPDVVCTQLPATWTQSSFDMRANYPKAYPVSQTVQADTSVASAPGATAVQAKAPVPAARPGAGLNQAQIETIVSSWYQGYYGTQFTLFETGYLVLKDGTVRKGLPTVGPSDFDLAADRAASPDLWGRWQKTGKSYAFRFPGDSGFTTPENDNVQVRTPPGFKLNNSFHASSGYQILGGAGSFSFRSLSLRGDGRFTRATHGFTGGTIGIGATAVSAGTTWDDKGSVTTVTGEGAAVRGGGGRTNGTTDADLEGTYRIDGYELVLTFDSGKRESHFFYVSANREMITVDNESMTVKTP